MNITIDDAQQFIVTTLKTIKLKSPPFNNQLHDNPFYNGGCDVWIYKVINNYISQQRNVSPFEQVTPNEIEENSVMFIEAAWDLCKKGILRPGTVTLDITPINQAISAGFSLTLFGHSWLARNDNVGLLPADPNRFTQIFDAFQPLFGSNYFRRAKEAVNCYQTGSNLACCVMCGAAIEAILLAAAFKIKDKSEVLKQYQQSRGRSNIEKLVFGKAPDYIKNYYSKFIDILSYWRDESGHGYDSDIDKYEPYIALTSLMHFAEFMRDHWSTLTNSQYSP